MTETKQFFQKVACFTDIHFGLKGDSNQHNTDCTNFISWFIEEANKFGAETCIFLGDWHHNRARISSKTMNVSLENIERLAKNFENFYFITGNHDLFYRDNRNVNSIEFGRLIDNVTIVSEPIVEDDVAIIPWILNDEWKDIKKLKSKYVFGHFELPGFLMNQMVKMPDQGTIHGDHFKYPEYVFSGHFHKRQIGTKIHYIGNAFPHDYNDINDDERGMMLLEWGGKPQYIEWSEAPNYRKLSLSQLLEEPEKWITKRSYVRVEMDVTPSFEDLAYIKEEIASAFNPRELSFVSVVDDEIIIDIDGNVSFETVDSVVLNHLDSIESVNIDKELLKQIYLGLDDDSSV